jgi:membrane protease YdiL (CAAX protease family)
VAGLSRNEIGFALPVGWRAYFWSIGGVVLSILYSSAETLLLHAVSNSSGEALIYQATMPGLDEELCFRGVGFAILSSAFCSKYEKISQWFMPSCIVSILFFVAHMNPDFSNVLSISFYVPVQILIPTLILMWIRLQTKSLFGSILAHNATNLTPMIISMA